MTCARPPLLQDNGMTMLGLVGSFSQVNARAHPLELNESVHQMTTNQQMTELLLLSQSDSIFKGVQMPPYNVHFQVSRPPIRNN